MPHHATLAPGVRRLAPARAVALALAALAFVLAVAPAGAQQGGGNADPRIDVTVDIVADAQRRDVIRVDVAGLDEFADGTLAIYQCGNADTAGRPIEPAQDDCFAPSDDGYLTSPIGDLDETTVRYRLARRGIGVNGARCIPALDGAASCQLVVGAVHGSDAEVVGIALDDTLADLDEAAAADRPEQAGPGDDQPATTLPVTGLGPRGVAIALFIAAGCVYVGSLLRSTTQAA